MEKEYNWKAILIGSVPVSIIIAFVFLSGSSTNSKWIYLILGMVVAGAITFTMDKKKHNIFTSPFVVAIPALLINGLRDLNIF